MLLWSLRGAIAESVELATPDDEILIPGFDPRSGRLRSTGRVGVSIMWPAETEFMVSPLYLCVAARKIVRRQSWNSSAI